MGKLKLRAVSQHGNQGTEYQDWLGKLPYPVIILDQNNAVIWANRAFIRNTGFNRKEVVGKQPPYPFWPAGKQKQHWLDLRRKTMHGQRLLLKKNGEQWWAEVSISQSPGNSGTLTRIMTFQDITLLRQIDEKYQIARSQVEQILDAIPVPVAIADADDMTFTQVNRSFEESGGFSRQEMIGRKIDDLSWANEQAGPQKPEALSANGPISDLEMRLRNKNGEVRTSIIKTHTARFGNKNFLISASLDITERKKAEEALLAAEKRYQSTLENMLEGCQIVSFDWNYLFVNAAAARQANKNAAETMGKSAMEVFPGIEKTAAFKVMQECMQKRISGQVENQLEYANGSTCWFKLSIHPVPEGIFILTVDINERKLAEEETRRLLIQQQAILDHIPDMAWLKDKNLRFIAVNEAFLKHGHMTAKEVLGKTDRDLFPEESAGKYLVDDRYVIEKGTGLTVEDQYLRPDAGTVWIETSKTPLFNQKGEVIGLAGIARDITNHKRNEAELQSANRMLRAIKEVNRIIMLEKDPLQLLENSCRILTSIRGYISCFIVQFDEKMQLLRSAQSQNHPNYEIKIKHMKEGLFPNCIRRAVNSGEAFVSQAANPVCENCPTFNPFGEDQMLVVPVRYDGMTRGVFSALVQQTNAVNAEEISLLQELTNDIGLALHNLQLEEKRQKTETELQVSEERFRMISEVAQDLIYRVNLRPEIRIDYLSASFERVLGYSFRELATKADLALDILHPDDRKTMSGHLTHPAEIGHAPFVIRWRHQKGHYVHIEHRHSIINDASGTPLAIVGIGRDITEHIRMEELLQASQLFSQRLLEYAPNPVMVFNEDTTVRFANPALFDLTGFTREEIIGRGSPYPWWPADKIAEHERVARHNRQLETVDQERMFQKKNGELIWVLVSVRVIKTHNKVDYTLSSWIDITERKKAELALLKSEKYSAGLINSAPNPILVSNPDSSIRYVNQSFEKVSGFSMEELAGLKIPYPWWAVPDQDVYINDDVYNRDKDGTRQERRYRKKNGDYFWVDLSINAIRDEGGKIQHFISNWVDITERKKYEQALQQSEEKNRLIFRSIADGVMICDLRGNIHDCNDAAVKVAGVPKSNIIGQNIKAYFLPEDYPRVLENIRKTMISGSSGHIQYVMVKPDGNKIPAETIANVARDQDGNPLYLVVSFHDITERRQLEQRMLELYETEKKQRKELQEEARMRGMFIDVLAHELRTPITPILASSGMLKDLLAESEKTIQKKLITNIANGAETLSHRLEELLDIARYSRGVFHLKRTPVNLFTFIHEVVTRFEPVLEPRNQKLITRVQDSLPMVEIDASKLEQVITNLLSNASKFSLEKGKIYFTASFQDEILSIDVRDEGIGITLEEQSRLFQPYHRVEQDRQKFTGIGLGLAVSRQIVEAHGGTIRVQSQSGCGSTFSLTIPVKTYQV